MIACLALLLAGRLDGQPITYESAAKPVGAVLADLAAITGLKLHANAEANREMVLVSVHDAAPKDLFDRIALVTGCEWEQVGDSYTLKPSPSLRVRERNQMLARRTEAIAAAIKQRAKTATEPGQDKTADAQAKSPDTFESLLSEDDSNEFITRLLQLVDPESLAQIEPEGRAVWATNNPTRTQTLIEGNSAALVQEWVGRHNALAAQVPAELKDQPVSGYPPGMEEEIRYDLAAVREPVAKVLLIVEREKPSEDFLNVAVHAYDAKGELLLKADCTIGTSDDSPNAADKSDESPPADSSLPIVYSADSKELIEATKDSSIIESHPPKVSASLRTELMHPERKDPLAYLVSDCLFCCAKDRGKDVVADVPDSSLEGLGLVNGGQIPKTANEARTAFDDEMSLKEDGKYLMVRPREPALDLENRVDRGALRRLLVSVDQKSIPSLEDLADFALADPAPADNPISSDYISVFADEGVLGGYHESDDGWVALQFLGSLSPSERQNLREGGKLAFQSLSQNSQRRASQLLFGADNVLEPEIPPKSNAEFQQNRSDFRHEPTELLPSGIPSGAFVSAAGKTAPIICASAEGTPVPRVVDIVELAWRSLRPASRSPLPKEGILGSRTIFNLEFHVGMGMMGTVALQDTLVPPNGAKILLSDLPPDLKSQVDAIAARMQKKLSTAKPDPSDKETPPP